MQEDFIHYIWKYKKFTQEGLRSCNQETISIISTGQHNFNAGPDFFNAQVRINDQLWAGNVEIHLKSSDWFLHNHEQDKAYDNVILHVVWEHNTEIFRKDNSVIPTLELKHYVSQLALNNYVKLFNNKQRWINCENDLTFVDDFTINNWLERLYFERLERKSEDVFKLLEHSKNDWETVLFKMIVKNFGLKVNGEAFLSMASSFEFSIIRKSQSSIEYLEALFFGQAGLLDGDVEEIYYHTLKKEHLFLSQKFGLDNRLVSSPSFFRLRPPNFPTIRLSQLANLYGKHQNLFSKLIEAKTIETIYSIFEVGASVFWESHYTFNKTSKVSKKRLTKSFINLLIINTIIPIKFSYAKYQGKIITEEILELIQLIPSERNTVVDKFNSLKKISASALQSQALIQLKHEYCNKNKCLQCAIGNKLLNQ